MPELAIPAGDVAKNAPAALGGAGGVGHAIAWWLACAGDSPFGREQTIVVTVTEPPRAPCDITALASGAFSNLIQPRAMPTQVVQATQILQTFPDAPAGQILAGDVFINASRTLLNQPSHDWPHAFLVATAPAPMRRLEAPERPATLVLRDLMRWTGGSAELVAETLGVSRRSIYNWLKGRPVRPEFATRAERLQLVLAPLREDWHPEALSDWLQAGTPSPAELAGQERWAEFEERVRDALRPLGPLRPQPDAADAARPEPWPAAALLAVLDEFNSPPPSPGRKTAWRPRELTGSTPEPDED